MTNVAMTVTVGSAEKSGSLLPGTLTSCPSTIQKPARKTSHNRPATRAQEYTRRGSGAARRYSRRAARFLTGPHFPSKNDHNAHNSSAMTRVDQGKAGACERLVSNNAAQTPDTIAVTRIASAPLQNMRMTQPAAVVSAFKN